MRRRLSMRKRNFIHLALVGALSSVFAVCASAANERCGVGSMLWGGGSSVSTQSSEESSNASLGDSFSITTGTSGCSNSGLVGITREQQFYANANFEELTRELAQGRGEVLAGFAQVLGCRTSVSGAFNAKMQSKFQEIYRSETVSPEQMLMNVKMQINADPVLAQGCQAITG